MKRGWEGVESGPPQCSTAFVTTSWDDGHVLDTRVAEMLTTYGLPGTFYIAPRNIEMPSNERLNAQSIASLGRDFEIGGHTLSHRRLPALSPHEARQEIEGGKSALEDILGDGVHAFCYPGGEYRPEHVELVREAGFSGARTVMRGVLQPTPAFEMDTTVNAYRHLVDGHATLRLADFNVRRAARLFWNWDLLAMELFDRVVRTGGIFHLWGHSWEVDQNDDWDRLARVLAYIGGRPEVEYLDNGNLALRTATT
jgi:peptidoglycan/xylan/chitin deacetylase (PgdA/CDA1 family)